VFTLIDLMELCITNMEYCIKGMRPKVLTAFAGRRADKQDIRRRARVGRRSDTPL